MYQAESGSGTDRATDYRDLVTKLVAAATSQHVATVAINNGGSGYVVGDVLTLTHAGAYLDARFEVLTAPAGVIATMRIVSSGAFSNRATTVASVVAGGGSYVVGDILEVQGGTARENAKLRVASLSGSAVATATIFETGGAYSSTPGAGTLATVGVGPAAFAGDDAATFTLTYTGLVGTTGLAVTGGTGSSATVDITLAQTGWDATERNTNDYTENSITDEKVVTLIGDATGLTNKPILYYRTGTYTSGINTRYHITHFASIAHNPAIATSSQVGNSGAVYVQCDEDALQEMDFWFSINTTRIVMMLNTNSGAAGTDSGEYHHHYGGYLTTFSTETEDPYPMFIFGSSRINTGDPSVGSQHITGLSECIAPAASAPGAKFYRASDASWNSVCNSQALSTNQDMTTIMHPLGQVPEISSPSNAADISFSNNSGAFWTGLGSTGRASPTRRLCMVPGSTPEHFLFPLTVIHRPGGASVDQTLDTVRGQLDGVFWVYNTDSSGATISDFSEDYITIGSDRYRVFHTHTQTQLYHYICILEDV